MLLYKRCERARAWDFHGLQIPLAFDSLECRAVENGGVEVGEKAGESAKYVGRRTEGSRFRHSYVLPEIDYLMLPLGIRQFFDRSAMLWAVRLEVFKHFLTKGC